MNKKIIVFYLLLLINHVAHIFEEIWGGFWLMDKVFGLGWFLVGNLIVLCIPVLLFYFVLQEKNWALNLSLIYAAIMILNGIGHNVATIISGKYFGGFAGGYSGIGLIIIGSALGYYLLKEKRICTN
jgi:hypothetical protein